MNFDLVKQFLSDSWISILFLVLSLPSIVYILVTGWDKVEYRRMGVVFSFDRLPETVDTDGRTKIVDLAKCGRREGPVLLWPWEYMKFVKTADIPLRVTANNLITGGDIPQKMKLVVALNIRFSNPARTLHSVVDLNPIQEFGPNIRAAIVAAAQSKSPASHLKEGASVELAEMIAATLEADPIAERWGIEVVSCRVDSLDISQAYMQAQETIVIAEARGQEEKIRAQARADAEKLQMDMELRHAEELHDSPAKDVAVWLKEKQTREEIHQRYAQGTGNATVILSEGGSDGAIDTNLLSTIKAATSSKKKTGGD